MKKTEVYIREYKKNEEEDYFNLTKNIREKSFTEDISDSKYLLSFDGIFLIRIYLDLLKKGYGSLISEAKAVIEKMGEDFNKDSEIEILLKKEGFKKV